jgi:nucleoside-diphosphate-sugar epimerase
LALDLIIHCAAVTDFGRPPEIYSAVNVTGTKNVIVLAFHRQKQPIRLLHLSTAYVSGDRSGVIREEELDVGQKFGNPYEESKFSAELLVRAAAARGLPTVVARPSIIVGEERTGRIREFRTIYTVLKVLTEGRVRAIPGAYDATLDLIPVNYAVAAVVGLAAEFDRAAGRTLHLVSKKAIALRDFSDVIAEYPSLCLPRVVPPSVFSYENLPSIEKKYHQRVVSLYTSYFVRRAEFASGAVQQILRGPLPAHGKPFLRRLINYGEKVGYFRPAGLNHFSPVEASA